MSKEDEKTEFIFVGKGSYSDSKINQSVKEGEKIYVDQSQVGYLKKVKIDGMNVFEEQKPKTEHKKDYSYKQKKEDKEIKDILDE